jgi:hypothetical protein
MQQDLKESFKAPYIIYDIVCLDKEGKEKWRETVKNLVVTQGLNDIIDKYFKGSAYTAAWFMGLKSTGAPDAADTLAAPVNWTEINPYSGNRKAITFGSTAGGSNTASAVSFAITSTATVAGAFIASVASGTSGILYSDSNFSVARGVANTDTLNVTATVVAA